MDKKPKVALKRTPEEQEELAEKYHRLQMVEAAAKTSGEPYQVAMDTDGEFYIYFPNNGRLFNKVPFNPVPVTEKDLAKVNPPDPEKSSVQKRSCTVGEFQEMKKVLEQEQAEKQLEMEKARPKYVEQKKGKQERRQRKEEEDKLKPFYKKVIASRLPDAFHRTYAVERQPMVWGETGEARGGPVPLVLEGGASWGLALIGGNGPGQVSSPLPVGKEDKGPTVGSMDPNNGGGGRGGPKRGKRGRGGANAGRGWVNGERGGAYRGRGWHNPERGGVNAGRGGGSSPEGVGANAGRGGANIERGGAKGGRGGSNSNGEQGGGNRGRGWVHRGRGRANANRGRGPQDGMHSSSSSVSSSDGNGSQASFRPNQNRPPTPKNDKTPTPGPSNYRPL